MDWLQSLLDSSTTPALTALVLGLLTAISPCPMATNITAIGFISKDIESDHRIFINGLLYTLGRIIAYTVLGFILIPLLKEGASIFSIQKIISDYGAMIIGPILLLIGLFMLFGSKLNLPKFGFSGNGEKFKNKGAIGSLLLGILFALAFCPTSAVFYFGMLIPMAAIETTGYLLPLIFAIATALPVIIVAWILAYSVASIGIFYSKMQVFQKYFSLLVAILFIVIGIYYCVIYLF